VISRLGPFNYDKEKDAKFIKSDDLQELYIYSTGATYTGYIHDNLKQGRGEMHWPDGSWYEGYWHKDKAYGPGRMIIVGKSLFLRNLHCKIN
jgi:hypothetical protein